MHEAVGRTQSTSDVMDPVRAQALYAVLGIDNAAPKIGDPLLPYSHQAYFWNIAGAADLGPDGHPSVGGFIPDLGLPNRMWAGGRLRFLNPLCAGIAAEKSTVIEKIETKRGRTGSLVFVTLRHEITQAGRLALTEWQDLVYRAASGKRLGRPGKPPKDPDHVIAVRFTETMLFRYSAITFNAHRIHYDAPFARREFGMPGPVVHGPLLAQLLMLLAQEHLGVVKSFDFRATAPLPVGEAAELCYRGDGTSWVRGAKGQLIMQAVAT